MKIICVMVASVDGKTTVGSNPQVSDWTSSEDQLYFADLVKKNPVVIMGRTTYEVARPMMKLSPQTLRVVMTTQPELFAEAAVAGQLEFTAEQPIALLKRLTAAGYTQGLLLGGSQLNLAFFTAGLVNELWLTREPVVLGEGQPVIAGAFIQPLKLISVEPLNQQGTLVSKYELLPPSLTPEPSTV